MSLSLLQEVKKMKNIDELESFLLKHGENIVDMLGGEIDRIELKLKVMHFFNSIGVNHASIKYELFYLQKKHPEIRHCDLEIL